MQESGVAAFWGTTRSHAGLDPWLSRRMRQTGGKGVQPEMLVCLVKEFGCYPGGHGQIVKDECDISERVSVYVLKI